ncbi:aminoacyl-tRNA deacylase [Vibrio mangrovi]|uniref:YbaK / prolyl-tRNA synthetases associated domain protein n=1 Tax=Vibrio mangrovi TaxID=474394 RepID=A0A1Y6IY09_9VIBR|nr:YbaK/EbsC family protein [Vibrio mangrovi]MDW6004633.1 YbaK/EbsC family protein [Vibrio mangrovi]SMS00923.1 YbaK / prolyl-tRNA synthetases associated domain protein [Vibrio mangrovi]
MTIATRLEHYLTEHHIPYQTLNHSHSQSSLHSAVTANVPPMSLAKGIILEDHEGRHLMAVLPSNKKISLAALNEELQASYHLVKEQEVYQLFRDCENGAIPPVGSAYHMSVVCDTSLADLDDVYLEAGDHETLLKLDKTAFEQLMSNSKSCNFSRRIFH